eukprot:3710904-Amphidinium_carterae.1
MGVMVAWPVGKYEATKIEIVRLSDTAPKETWPKSERVMCPTASTHSHGWMCCQRKPHMCIGACSDAVRSQRRPPSTGTLSPYEVKEITGDYPPSSVADFDEWYTARNRKNEACCCPALHNRTQAVEDMAHIVAFRFAFNQ